MHAIERNDEEAERSRAIEPFEKWFVRSFRDYLTTAVTARCGRAPTSTELEGIELQAWVLALKTAEHLAAELKSDWTDVERNVRLDMQVVKIILDLIDEYLTAIEGAVDPLTCDYPS